MEVTDWDKNFVNLKWISPKEDGGSPITGYVIEVKDKSGIWEKALTVPVDKTTATVPNLVEGELYIFQVRAVNAAGPGEASDTTNTILAKPRNSAPHIDRINLNDIKIKAGQTISYDIKVS